MDYSQITTTIDFGGALRADYEWFQAPTGKGFLLGRVPNTFQHRLFKGPLAKLNRKLDSFIKIMERALAEQGSGNPWDIGSGLGIPRDSPHLPKLLSYL